MKPFTRHTIVGFNEIKHVFVTTKWDGKRLSMSGVVGPRSNGDAESAGQIDLSGVIARKDIPLDRIAEIWKRWHLNDMRAGCEHQRAEEWDKRPIDPSKPLNTYGTHFEGQKLPTWNMLTWVRPSEHPDGLLTKPCPTCGYKFGTEWLYEDVPEEVLVELAALPDDSESLPAIWQSPNPRY